MKNKLALRLLAVCACAVVLLTASFAKTTPLTPCPEKSNKLKKRIENNLALMLPCPISPIQVDVTNLLDGTVKVKLTGDVPSTMLAENMTYAQWVKGIARSTSFCITVVDPGSMLNEIPAVEATMSCSDLTRNKLRNFVEGRLKSKRLCGDAKFEVEVQKKDDGKFELKIPNCPSCPDSVRQIVGEALAGLGDCVKNTTPDKPPSSLPRLPCPPPCPQPDLTCNGGVRCLDAGGNVVCYSGSRCPNSN